VFFVDLSLHLGVAEGVPYVVLVMVRWWYPQKACGPGSGRHRHRTNFCGLRAVTPGRGGSVSLCAEETNEESLRITVADSGLGIPEDMQSQVLEPFQRLGQEKSDLEGTGIGLTPTKRMVEDMGGRIGFRSAMGRGSEFWLDFPIIGEHQVVDCFPGGSTECPTAH